MYSLDINFLNDRPDYRPQAAATSVKGPKLPSSSREQTIMYAGLATVILLPALVFGATMWVNQQNAQLTAQRDELDGQLGALQTKLQQVESVRTQTKNIQEQIDALATVFNQIKPWSALFEDIQQRTPGGVQISTIVQSDPKLDQAAPPPASTAAGTAAPASTIPTATLEIKGLAQSFDNVNDFVVVLRRSPFFVASETQLKTAQLKDNPVQIEGSNDESAEAIADFKMPKVVEYTILTRLSDKAASEMLAQLRNQGAIGLVTRIETLQDRGVIKP